jgi:flagellar biosynthesis/type III secretory pathway M-ring protein FliF/YscJ
LSVVAALIYFVVPVACAIGVLYLIFKVFFKDLKRREAAEKEQTELRKRLMEEFPENKEIERDLNGDLTDEEIEQSIAELKKEEGD